MVTTDTIRRARKFAADYYHRRKNDPENIGHHPSHLASEAIEAAGKQFAIGFGSAGFCWDCGRDGITYLNMGDTYDFTILFDSRSERFSTGCWGDVVERLERDGITIE